MNEPGEEGEGEKARKDGAYRPTDDMVRVFLKYLKISSQKIGTHVLATLVRGGLFLKFIKRVLHFGSVFNEAMQILICLSCSDSDEVVQSLFDEGLVVLTAKVMSDNKGVWFEENNEADVFWFWSNLLGDPHFINADQVCKRNLLTIELFEVVNLHSLVLEFLNSLDGAVSNKSKLTSCIFLVRNLLLHPNGIAEAKVPITSVI